MSTYREHLLPLVLCGLTIPASIMLWLFNVIFSKITNGTTHTNILITSSSGIGNL